MFHYRTTNKLNKHMYNLKKKKKKKKKRKAYLPTLFFFNPLQETNIYFFLALSVLCWGKKGRGWLERGGGQTKLCEVFT